MKCERSELPQLACQQQRNVRRHPVSQATGALTRGARRDACNVTARDSNPASGADAQYERGNRTRYAGLPEGTMRGHMQHSRPRARDVRLTLIRQQAFGRNERV